MFRFIEPSSGQFTKHAHSVLLTEQITV